MNECYISIVASSRNDDHGGRLLERMQTFVNGVIEQSMRHQVFIELILVEWNPPQDRPRLSHALKIPKDKPYCAIRIITVCPKLHQTFKGANNMPLYQMIAKNVGIRRAKGEYILATNIDILFSDQLFALFKKKKLRSKTIYRVDRLDIPSNLPHTGSFQDVLDFCQNNFFRIHKRFRTKMIQRNRMKRKKERKKFAKQLKFILRKCLSPNITDFNRWKTLISQTFKQIKLPNSYLHFDSEKYLKYFKYLLDWFKMFVIRTSKWKLCLILHSNGCGDFTLLSKKGWEILRGYPEWPIFSWHIDSLFLYQGVMSGFLHKNFGSKKPIYHIEHSVGSGYTPEGVDILFSRLKEKKIPYLDMPRFNQHVKKLIQAKRESKKILYNGSDWGMIDQELEGVNL